MSNSFTTAPNTRLLVITPDRAGGFGVYSAYQNGGSQHAACLGFDATLEAAQERAARHAETMGECWRLVLNGRETTWTPPIYPKIDERFSHYRMR